MILQTFSSHHTHTPCPTTADVALPILWTLSAHYTTSTFCTCNLPGTAHFYSLYHKCAILILQTFSSHQTPSPLAADVAVLIMHTLLTLHNFLLVLQVWPSMYSTLLSLYCKCDIPDNADFLLTPRTLSSYCKCSPSHPIHSLLTLQNLLLVLQIWHTRYCTLSLCTVDVTFLILQTFFSYHTPCLPTAGMTFWYCKLSPCILQSSPHTADATCLVLHTFSTCTADVTLLILQTLSLYHTPVILLHMYHSDTVQFLLTLHNLLLVMQQRPSWYHTFLASYHRSDLADTTEFLLTLDTLWFYCRCSPSHPIHSLLTLHNLLLVLQIWHTRYCTLSLCTVNVTFLILQTFFSHHTPCLPTAGMTFWYCKLSPCILQSSPHTADATCLVLHTFSTCTADVTLLILQTLSLYHTPVILLHMYHSDTVQFLLTLHNLLLVMQQRPSWYHTFLASYHRSDLADTTEFLLTLDTLWFYCRCSPSHPIHSPHTAQPSSCTADMTHQVLHTLSLHCRCDIPDTTDFFLTPHTLSSYCRYDLLILQTLSLHSTKLSSYCRCDLPCATHFLYLYCRCDTPDTADFVLIPHTCLPTPHVPFWYCRVSPHTAQPSSCNAAATFLVPHFLASYHRSDLADTTEFLLTLDTLWFYCRCSPSHPIHSLLTLHNLLLVLQIWHTRYCTLSLCTVDVTFLILQTFFSHHTPCLPTAGMTFWYCKLSPCILQSSPRTADATCLVLHTFSTCTADVTLLILQTSSLYHTPVFLLHMYHSDTVEFLLTLHNLLLVMQQRPSWYHTFLASYHRSDLADTTEFLLTLDTLWFCCRCSPSDIEHSLITLHNHLLILEMQPSW